MHVADNPFSKNLATFLGYTGHYERSEEFQRNLDLIETKIGLDRANIYKWINGKGGFTYDSLVKVCNLFGWDIYELFVDHDKYVNLKSLDKEYMEIIRMLPMVKNKDILASIMSIIRFGLMANGRNEPK